MSAPNETFLSDMRDGVRALMEADPYYMGIPIISERLKNIEGKIAETVGKVGGIAILLVTPILGGVLPNLGGANFSAIQFIARIFENTTTNPTGKEALEVAIHTAALWSQLKPDALSSPLKLDDPAIALGNDPRYLSYDVAALTEGGSALEIPRLADLVHESKGGDSHLLSHPTPGAAIFYTLDGSPALPRNPAAALYLDTFIAAPGATLRARAWLPGFIPSAEKRLVL